MYQSIIGGDGKWSPNNRVRNKNQHNQRINESTNQRINEPNNSSEPFSIIRIRFSKNKEENRKKTKLLKERQHPVGKNYHETSSKEYSCIYKFIYKSNTV